MGAVSSPIQMIEAASGVSPYASLHLPTSVLSSATPQDIAVLSVQAVQLGETDSLFGHSQANTPFAAQAAIDGAISNTNPPPSLAPTGSSQPAPADETPQQLAAGQQLQTVQSLYSGQTKPAPAFSLLG